MRHSARSRARLRVSAHAPRAQGQRSSHRPGSHRAAHARQRHPSAPQAALQGDDSKHLMPVADNLLQRNFTPEAPNRVWTGDITYIATDEGWLYLAVVL